ncbi:C-type lectin domain containing protein [Trichostrongylus colubriformis]|uniref:C-type lectin domain containing protein n=1 Tax=Trichostrongylus colubriformis TaxID=6319 RepID=A0AAN8EUB4_TRICO
MLLKSVLALCLVSFAASQEGNSTQESASQGSNNVQESGCPIGWLRLFSSCYLFETTHLTFEAAESNCLGKGGRLFVPRTAVEWKEVVKNSPKVSWNWVGLKREGVFMPRWRRTGGMNVAEINWLIDPGTPEMNGWSSGSQCLAYYNSDYNSYAFFHYCDMKYNSICKSRAAGIPRKGLLDEFV